ncbi:MAG: DEAD/DEAH box helicase, partial [Candidatus Aminicenantes bacterium]
MLRIAPLSNCDGIHNSSFIIRSSPSILVPSSGCMNAPPTDPLRLFDPAIADWFGSRFGQSTDIQSIAWPRIAAGEHVLLTAPTGSGKTFAAFLWALDRLLTGEWETGATRVLYISPLKALGNDIRRNLTEPLAELGERFATEERPTTAIRVESRTGDTPQSARRRMQRSPPEILITTPESLNILLTSRSGRRILTVLRCVILDEVHAVAAGKRGVHLITAVERLTALSGEFQRIALSATVRPLDRMARWVGGFTAEGNPGDPVYHPRRVAVIASDAPKATRLEVVLPTMEPETDNREPDAFWAGFGRQLRSSIASNRSTLVFGNSRRSVEKITRFINEAAPERPAYSHHGALSREIRAVVEQRLKNGERKVIVATSSLELGIDIGAIDEVVMVQTPPSVASTMQRLGRSGHGVGETSRGRLMPLLGRDLLEAAVVARCGLDREIEELRPITGALDGEMTVTKTTDSGNTVYRFNGPEHATEPPGKITLFAYGDPDDANNKAKLTYVYSGGVLSYIEDGYGRQVHFEFSVGGNLVKIIEPNPAAPDPKTNMCGRITYIAWDNNMVESITIGMPNTLAPGYGEDWDDVNWSDYTTRTTAFVYESNRLAYVILPDQYDAWRADQDPPTNVASYAAQIFTYYTSGVN